MNVVSEIRESRGIMLISADGCEALRVRKKHFLKKPLAAGELVELSAYENAMAALQFPDAYEAALTALDFSARTASEIQRSLLSKGYVAPAAQAVVEKLQENHLIDDRRFAERMAEANASKPTGIYAMKRKLRAKGIDEDIASDALEIFDEEQQASAAAKAAEKLYRRYSGLPVREARAKLLQALARRGFSWEIVRSTVDALIGEEYEWD